jgi:hypothetical protein
VCGDATARERYQPTVLVSSLGRSGGVRGGTISGIYTHSVGLSDTSGTGRRSVSASSFDHITNFNNPASGGPNNGLTLKWNNQIELVAIVHPAPPSAEFWETLVRGTNGWGSFPNGLKSDSSCVPRCRKIF